MPGKHLRFTTNDSCSWNITHNKESTTVWNLKPEWWGSPLVEEQCQEEKTCDDDGNHNSQRVLASFETSYISIA
jgi:hypothetical protein